MTPGRFCIAFVGAALAAAACAAAFNFFTDPYLLFDRPRLEGYNAVKPAVWTRERMIKAYHAPRVAARTVILGSSRSDIGLDPSRPVWPPESRPVYNLSLAGTDTHVAARYLQHAVALRPQGGAPGLIVAGLDFESFLFRPAAPSPEDDELEERLAVRANGQPNPARSLRRLKDYATGTLSLDAISDSIASIVASRVPGSVSIEPAGNLSDSGLRSVTAANGAAALFARKASDMVRQMSAPRMVISETPGGPVRGLSAVRRLIEIARSHDARILLYVQPAHADQYELLDRMGYWDEFERWKRALTELVAAEKSTGVVMWDFAGYEDYSLERVPAAGDMASRLQWFWEPAHYTKALGDMMVARMLGRPAPEAHGVELTPQSVDARIAAIRRARDAYRASSPGEVRRVAELFCSAAPRQCGGGVADNIRLKR